MQLSRFRLPAIWTTSILSILLCIHLIGVYIYEGGSVVGVSGGSINVGFVGTSPNIPNPLAFGQNKQHDLIINFLFRSAIRYDSANGLYEGDLARCDLADLSKVKCTLAGSGVWSDGTDIKVDDFIATYQAFRDATTQDKMKAFLGKVSIISKDAGTIELSSDEKNSLMLDLLSYPVLRSDVIERIRTDRMSKEGYVTSGAYVFLENEKNEQYGYDRITIGRNEKDRSVGWLDKYNFLFFPDTTSLERGAEILSIVVPPDISAKMFLGPRFQEYEYATYEYTGLFQNTDTVSNAVRKHVFLQSKSGLSGSVVPGERPVEHLFHPEENTPIKLEKNFADVMRESGYKKVEERMNELEKEDGMLTGSSIVYEDNLYFDTPSKKKIIFSELAEGVITLGGNVPLGIKNVNINGYSLKEFLPGNNRFTYKVSLADGTLIEGKNTYELEFESSAGTKAIRDTLTLYYHRDPVALSGAIKSVEDAYLEKLNTRELVDERLKKINAQKEKVKALNPRYYYNAKLLPYELDLVYLSDPASLETYATNVSNTLLGIGIKVNIASMSSKDFSAMLQKGEKNYDILLVGFEANGRFSRIGQIFLSTEAKTGINFAKIESKSLDALFASLRVSFTREKTDEVEKKISEYLKSEAFFFPISSPLHQIYIDRTLKGIRTIPTFQDITSLHSVIQKVSIKEEYLLNTGEKSFGGFFSWVWHKIGF